MICNQIVFAYLITNSEWRNTTMPKTQCLNDMLFKTVECLTVPLWYKQQETFLNPKFD